jgi:hypothetical protein
VDKSSLKLYDEMIAKQAMALIWTAKVPRELLASAVLILASVVSIGNMLWIGRGASLDMVIYRCYAHVFWDGPPMPHAASTKVCVSLWSSPPRQFHTFPREYTALALVIFSLPLLLPWVSYTAGFLAWMGLLLLVTKSNIDYVSRPAYRRSRHC